MLGFLDSLNDLNTKGHRVIGCFPLYPPLELFHSFGLKPVVLWGLGGDLGGFPKSDRHLQPYTCQVARSLMEFVLGNAPGPMDALFMYNACDTLRNLPEIIAVALRGQGTHLPLFRLHVPALPMGQAGASGYLRARIRALVEELEGFTGRPFSDQSFADSIGLYRRQRSLCIEVEELAGAGSLPFSRCMDLLMASNRIPVEDHIPLLEAMINEAGSSTAGDDGKPGVLISGILPPPTPLAAAMEASGLRIVANDIAALRRFYGHTPVGKADPEIYYENFYLNHHPCTTILPSADQRVEMLKRTVKEKQVKGFIFIGEKFCEYEYFEFPHIEGMLKAMDVKTLFLEMSVEGVQNLDGYRTRIEAFAETLDQGNS
jgi:benzoyl-CoA reductase/2-hydroxyglutaryl-CoA dehydratase subunit BcrC/BadD/HgdB